jgi:ATP-binding cassette subfamily B protein
MSQMSAYAQESFAAIRLIKSLVQELRVKTRFGELSQDYEREGILMAKYQAIFSPALGLLTNLGTFLILLLGGMDVMHGLITVGTFVAFQRFVVQLSWPMEAIGWAVTMNQEGVAAYRRLSEVLKAPQVTSVRAAPSRLQPSTALLEIRSLPYHYPADGGFQLALQEMTVTPGQKIGLVGPVGSGKTTFFNLLLRLYEPPLKSVFLDGRDIAEIPLGDLRQRIASVEQSVFLFSEKLSTNLRLGYSRDVADDSVRQAMETAQVLDEVLDLDRGIETVLSERGVNLSGGQKQRVALARALIRQPQLLLLDDAFSAVDVAVENRIIESFFSSYQALAVVFASHRLSVMPRMDEIWLMQAGSLVARGSHAELIRRNGLYQKLWEKSERQLELEALGVAPPEEIDAGGVR